MRCALGCGGTQLTDAFMEACDEGGVLVWLDLMFACALYPIHSAFLQHVREEPAWVLSVPLCCDGRWQTSIRSGGRPQRSSKFKYFNFMFASGEHQHQKCLSNTRYGPHGALPDAATGCGSVFIGPPLT